MHHSFIVPGIVDKDVMYKQAHERADKKLETTKVHHHSEGRACTRECTIIKGGRQDEGMILDDNNS